MIKISWNFELGLLGDLFIMSYFEICIEKNKFSVYFNVEMAPYLHYKTEKRNMFESLLKKKKISAILLQ